MGGVQSLNEPDIYTGLGRTSEPTDAAATERAATLRPVVRACTQLLLHAQRLRHPDKEVIVVKTRAQVVRCHALPTLARALTTSPSPSLSPNPSPSPNLNPGAERQRVAGMLYKEALQTHTLEEQALTLTLTIPLPQP